MNVVAAGDADAGDFTNFCHKKRGSGGKGPRY
jgi:hypothetical protein